MVEVNGDIPEDVVAFPSLSFGVRLVRRSEGILLAFDTEDEEGGIGLCFPPELAQEFVNNVVAVATEEEIATALVERNKNQVLR